MTATPEPPGLADEIAARRTLARNRWMAHGLLTLVAIVFILTLPWPHPDYWVLLLRAGALAGIIGGLADWFAVTAIFRRPLGLPIPHTAVLPRNKERIGRAISLFVERSFLTEAVLAPRLRAAQPGRRAAAWLAAPENAALLVSPLVETLPQILQALDDADLRAFFNRLLRDELSQVELAPLFGRSLDILTHSGEAGRLLDRAIALAKAWLIENRGRLEQLVRERGAWWMPGFMNRRLARTLTDGMLDFLDELADPDGEARRAFSEALVAWTERLITEPGAAAELNAARDRLLSDPQLQAWLNSVWTQGSQALSNDLAAPSSRTRQVLEQVALSLGEALARDEAMQAKIDEATEWATLRVLSFRGEAARFMADVIAGWDARTITARLELVIGGDLQYIRMNGTLVGALVGCLIFVASHA